jgi:phosphatidylglycerol:prolipoprotein diacylglycerol transferase
MCIFARKNQLPTLHLVDIVAITAPPGLFLGRLANFVNGELWGKRLPEAMQLDPPWWSVKYPEEIYLGTIDVSSVASTVGGDTTLHTQIVDSLRLADPVVTEALIGQLTAWWPSQLFQALSDGPILMAILIAVWWRPRRPGIVGGWFLVGYGALRIVTEVVRQPDDGVDLLFGLQRGQLLSVGIMLLGFAAIVVCSQRSVQAIGGIWRPRQNKTDVNEARSE